MTIPDSRVALVTGAGGGIGSAICRRLAQDGAFVVAADIDAAAARRAIDALDGADGLAVALDVAKRADWQAAIEATRRSTGRLDILVNNAGIAHIRPLEALTLEAWNRDIEVNLTGAFLGIQEALALMRETASRSASGAAIINIASVSALVGSPGMPGYSASKGGLRLFSKAIALDFAKKRYGIRVNSIYPGLIDTALTSPLFESMRAPDSVASVDEIRQRVIDRYPIGRIGRPDEIAGVVSFLAGDDSSYMVGAELVVDGGLTAE